MIPILKYTKETCGCCWHFEVVGKYISFGRKDYLYYLELFATVIWIDKND